jgi:glycosyltransferase involved in cell wall biosynthesis
MNPAPFYCGEMLLQRKRGGVKVALCLLRSGVRGIGGDLASVYNLALELKKNGVEVLLVTPKLSKKLDCERIEYIPYGWKDYLIPLSIIFFIKKVRKLSREADVIHCFYPLVIFEVLNYFIRIGLKRRLITTYGTPVADNLRKIRHLLKKDIRQYLPRLCINNKFVLRLLRFKGIYTVSTEYQKRQLTALAPGIDIRVISNGIDVDRYGAFDLKRAKAAFGFGDNFIITYIGHFTHMKGVEVLVDAFRIVIKSAPQCRLVLAISGAEKDMVFWKRRGSLKISNLIRGLEDKTAVMGMVDVRLLFSASDAAVFPYLADFGSNMIPTLPLEAMAVGVPIISTQIEIAKEVFDDERLAILVPPDNPDKLAGALLQAFYNKGKREIMAEYQRMRAGESYNSKVTAGRFLELYNADSFSP